MKAVDTNPAKTEKEELKNMALRVIKELETDRGILASGKEEIFGCVFGRDSLITGLKLLRAYQKTGDVYFLSVVKKILQSMASLQGREVNIESGEEYGKIIHEYREDNHEHLTGRKDKPWYRYPDGTMKNYDSVDSTLLFLIAVSRYYELSHDSEFLSSIMENVEAALEWVVSKSKIHPQGFISYDFPEERKSGGLATQSWMDSFDSIFHEDGSTVLYPISPVEVQGYAYVALRLWARHTENEKPSLSLKLERCANNLKTEFNKHFVSNTEDFKIAFAIDGAGKPMFSKRSSPGHLLWIAFGFGPGSNDSILEAVYVPKLVSFLFARDLFNKMGGMRTLAENSKYFNPKSYHNGSIWPHDNAIIAEGLENFGYESESKDIQEAVRRAWQNFKTPIELYVYDEDFEEYVSSCGQKACTNQAWSAASILSEL